MIVVESPLLRVQVVTYGRGQNGKGEKLKQRWKQLEWSPYKGFTFYQDNKLCATQLAKNPNCFMLFTLPPQYGTLALTLPANLIFTTTHGSVTTWPTKAQSLRMRQPPLVVGSGYRAGQPHILK